MNIAMDLIREALLGGSGGGGGGGGMTKVFEKTYTVSTSSSSETVVANLENILEPGAWYYCSVVDNAGKRNDYYYGSEFFMRQIIYSAGQNFDNRVIGVSYCFTQQGAPYFSVYGTSYGIYPKPTNKNTMSICSKYSNTYTHTIDGDYTVTIYRMPDLIPIWDGT